MILRIQNPITKILNNIENEKTRTNTANKVANIALTVGAVAALALLGVAAFVLVTGALPFIWPVVLAGGALLAIGAGLYVFLGAGSANGPDVMKEFKINPRDKVPGEDKSFIELKKSTEETVRLDEERSTGLKFDSVKRIVDAETDEKKKENILFSSCQSLPGVISEDILTMESNGKYLYSNTGDEIPKPEYILDEKKRKTTIKTFFSRKSTSTGRKKLIHATIIFNWDTADTKVTLRHAKLVSPSNHNSNA